MQFLRTWDDLSSRERIVRSVSRIRSFGNLVGRLRDTVSVGEEGREGEDVLASLEEDDGNFGTNVGIEVEEALKEEVEEGFQLALLLVCICVKSFGRGKLLDEESDDFEDRISHRVRLRESSSVGGLRAENGGLTSLSRCFWRRAICLRTRRGETSARRMRNLENDRGPFVSCALNCLSAISLSSLVSIVR
jgi:hypothetical protein